MPEEYIPLEPGKNAVMGVRRGIAYIVAQCFVCKEDFDYKKPLDDYETKNVEICEQCAPFVSVQFSPELWP